MLQSMGSQRVGHDSVTEQQQYPSIDVRFPVHTGLVPVLLTTVTSATSPVPGTWEVISKYLLSE